MIITLYCLHYNDLIYVVHKKNCVNKSFSHRYTEVFLILLLPLKPLHQLCKLMGREANGRGFMIRLCRIIAFGSVGGQHRNKVNRLIHRKRSPFPKRGR